ncbi:MAG: methyltransferase domain-containing protein [Haloferacaceae archaeon]
MAADHPVDALLADPWAALRVAFGDPLHPGGRAATAALLDSAGVGSGTRLLDAGCGAGAAFALARERGARPVGVDRDPATGPDGADPSATVRGDVARLPLRAGAVEVVLSECVLCLAPSVERTLAEFRRVLASGGRLALSDVVVEGDPPDLPAPLAGALCLAGDRSRGALLDRLDAAGFAVGEVRDHRSDLLAMRDRAADRIDYEGLLGALGERGRALRAGVRRLERAVEAGRVSYVSLVATVP